jgi:hypothetical protein
LSATEGRVLFGCAFPVPPVPVTGRGAFLFQNSISCIYVLRYNKVKMEQAGRIERIGNKRFGYWRINE